MAASIPSAWLTVLSDRQLKHLSSDAIFSRAQSYLGQVRHIHVPPLRTGEQMAAQANVKGSKRRPYTTRVWITMNGKLEGECTCPNAEDGYFCKHQVAVSLKLRQFLNNDTATVVEAKTEAATTRTPFNMRAFLAAQSQRDLVDKLCAWAQSQPSLMNAIERWAQPVTTAAAPTPPSSPVLKQLNTQLSPLIVGATGQGRDVEEHRKRKGYRLYDDDDMGPTSNLTDMLPLLAPLNKMSIEDILKVAQQLPNTAPEQQEAVRLFKFVFDKTMPNASSPYESTLRLVKEIAIRLPQGERVLWLHGIRNTYKLKRNFIKGLDEMTFPS